MSLAITIVVAMAIMQAAFSFEALRWFGLPVQRRLEGVGVGRVHTVVAGAGFFLSLMAWWAFYLLLPAMFVIHTSATVAGVAPRAIGRFWPIGFFLGLFLGMVLTRSRLRRANKRVESDRATPSRSRAGRYPGEWD